jgi:hypothetical protein
MFEAFALELLKMLPVHQACRLLGTYDKKLWDMMPIYTEKAQEGLRIIRLLSAYA